MGEGYIFLFDSRSKYILLETSDSGCHTVWKTFSFCVLVCLFLGLVGMKATYKHIFHVCVLTSSSLIHAVVYKVGHTHGLNLVWVPLDR
jgi:hypothetical protein